MSTSLFHAALYASLAVCALGVAWRVSTWLRIGIGAEARGIAPARRARVVLATVASALFGREAIRILGEFLLDTLLLRRLFAREKLRAVAHLLVVAGFVALIAMHALSPLVAARLFPGYQPTLEPWLLLRNLFGATMLAGLAWLVVERRRAASRAGLPMRRCAQAFATLLAVVAVTGFLLEAHKIASPRAFERMADQFAAAADDADLASLRALWARDFGVAFDARKDAVAPVVTGEAARLHADACASCHARPASAFLSWRLAGAMAPAVRVLDELRADAWLLHLHVLACLLGLATLPFTSFFHVLAAPLSLLVDAIARARARSPAALGAEVRAARRALAQDACVRCGLCDGDCSVAPLSRALGNPELLPSRKVVATRAMATGRLPPSDRHRRAAAAPVVADGAHLCTDCGRCTERCPVGLDLADLWDAGREDLAAAGLPPTAAWVQARPAVAWAKALERGSDAKARHAPGASHAPLASDRRAFSRCVQCQTCTNVCPVVAHAAGGDPTIDLTPQKVMNLLRLGLPELALGSRMVWSCATCYQCQEHCPEGIRVADIMCELRSLAVERLGRVRQVGERS